MSEGDWDEHGDGHAADHVSNHAGAALLERLAFFSDAVFAIAMTLLVVEVRLPRLPAATDAELGHALLALAPNYIGFVVSFLVVGRFWMGHHRILGLLRASDDRLVRVNLLFLMAVAFMPFPTAVLSEYASLRLGGGFYAAWLTLIGLLNRLLAGAALGSGRLVRTDVPAERRGLSIRLSWTAVIVGATAFCLAMISPLAAQVALLATSPVASWLLRRGLKAEDGSPAPPVTPG